MRTIELLPLLLLLPSLLAAEPVRPAQLGLCAACHGEDGRGREPGTPHLNGQDQSYLRESLMAYRRGERRHSAMRAAVGALTEARIAELASWYAAQPLCPPGSGR